MSGRRHQPQALHPEAGLTLVEMLITMVVTLLIVGATVQMIVAVQQSYATQQTRLEARTNARATMDMIARLARTATTVDPDPDGNGVLDSIRLVGDWNPDNGAADPYEDVTFTTAGGMVRKQEPTDGVPAPFADRVASLAFAYRDTNNVVIAAPVAGGAIAFIDIIVTTTAFRDGPGVVFRTSSAVRLRE